MTGVTPSGGRSAALRVEPASPSQAKPAAANAFTPEAIEAASIEVERLQRELDITNADHIALWLEANMADSPLGWLACRIVEAHEAILDNPPKHSFWGAGERDAPRDIRASNGELHTLRCKVCGLDDPIDRICRPRRTGGAA